MKRPGSVFAVSKVTFGLLANYYRPLLHPYREKTLPLITQLTPQIQNPSVSLGAAGCPGSLTLPSSLSTNILYSGHCLICPFVRGKKGCLAQSIQVSPLWFQAHRVLDLHLLGMFYLVYVIG